MLATCIKTTVLHDLISPLRESIRVPGLSISCFCFVVVFLNWVWRKLLILCIFCCCEMSLLNWNICPCIRSQWWIHPHLHLRAQSCLWFILGFPQTHNPVSNFSSAVDLLNFLKNMLLRYRIDTFVNITSLTFGFYIDV